MGKKKNIAKNPPPAAPPAPRNSKALIVIAVLVVLTVAGLFLFRNRLGFHRSLQAGKFKDYNVLFVTLDTTRADHLGFYGDRDAKTPHLDALAHDSFVFEDAISQAPLTLPSHTSMMTGRLPIGHGVRDNAGFFLDPSETTLAEVFKQAGYSTAAFVSAFVLDSRWQLNQGFDHYYDAFNLAPFQDISPRDIQRRGEETEIEAAHWLQDHSSEKFFSWVHFYDPHEPYDPPDPYRSVFADSPYDGEIAYMDDVFGKLMAKLDDLGVKDRTIIVVAGDHGESLGEHGEATHAMFVYNTTQHVPLFIHIPGAGGERIKGVVSLIDIAPTLLELEALPVVQAMQGGSLIGKINGSDHKQRIAYSESTYAEIHYGWSPLESVTTDEYKFINAPRPELYDRVKDRNEATNLYAEKSSYAKVLQNDLQDMIKRYASKNLAGPQKMDPDTEEKLRALGYIGNTAVSTAESRKIDPKDKIELAGRIQLSLDALQAHKYKEAMDRVETVLRDDPNMVDAHFAAGVAAIGLNQLDLAVDELLKTLSLRPNYTYAEYNLGYTYELKGDLKQAEYWFKKVLEHEPSHLFSTLKLAHVYREQNEPELSRPYFLKAVDSYQRALETTKGEKARSALYSTLGEIYFGAGDLSRAETSYRSAIELNPKGDSLYFNLAQIHEARGDIMGAVDAYRNEIQVDPKSFKSFNNLGLIYKNTNRLEDASVCFQKVIDLDPEDPRGYLLLAGTYRKMGRSNEAGQVIRMAQQRGIPID